MRVRCMWYVMSRYVGVSKGVCAERGRGCVPTVTLATDPEVSIICSTPIDSFSHGPQIQIFTIPFVINGYICIE